MTESKKDEIKSEAELLYKKASKLLEDGEITLPNDLQESFLNLYKSTAEEQLDLISKLSKLKLSESEKLPDIIVNLIELVQFKQAPLFLSKVPEEIPKKISTYGDDLTLRSLALTNKTVNTLFNAERVFTKFLQQAAFGGQDKIEKLFTLLKKQKRDKEIQELLCKTGTMADYSGRTFECTAYEYAYWAKDTHMCRMLEQYMNEDTKKEMLKRCEAIEQDGLKYTQNKKEYCTKHFDLTPLKEALKEYIEGYDKWNTDDDWEGINRAWMKVGIAQRDVPAHLIHEYCRPDRSFENPTFKEDKLPRVSKFWDGPNGNRLLLPFIITEKHGLGVDFALCRSKDKSNASGGLAGHWEDSSVAIDLLAVELLDKVRTEDLKQSLENLKPKELKHKLVF